MRGLLDEDGVRLADEVKELEDVKSFYGKLMKEEKDRCSNWEVIDSTVNDPKWGSGGARLMD